MSNAEGGGRSVYMHKTATGKLKFGPLWDFDTQFLDGDVDSDDKKLLCAQHQLFFTTFLKNENYYDKVVARYNETRVNSAALYVEMLEHEELIKETALIDSRIWFGDYNTFAIGCEYVTKGLLQRRTRLDEVFALAHNEFVDLITK